MNPVIALLIIAVAIITLIYVIANNGYLKKILQKLNDTGPQTEPVTRPTIRFLINNFYLKTKGGFMTVEQTTKQRFEFDVDFKNKKGNAAFVDDAISLAFKNAAGEVVSLPNVTATASAVSPNEAGDSSTHHVVVETDDTDITEKTLATLFGKADIDTENDADASTAEDVKEQEFELVSFVFSPMKASTVGISNAAGPVDL